MIGETRMIAAGWPRRAVRPVVTAFRRRLGLHQGGFVIRSLTMLVTSLTLQVVMLGAWLAWRNAMPSWDRCANGGAALARAS
jgi:hypothetical protein